MLSQINRQDILEIALCAGKEILKIYGKDYTINYKQDSSPFVEADLISNKIICDALSIRYPNIPIISEENNTIPYSTRVSWDYFWCIDPIDGTKEFISKSDEFTINIALIHKNCPILGLVYAPALDLWYYAQKNSGVFVNGVALPLAHSSYNAISRLNKNSKIKILSSKSHSNKETQDFIHSLQAYYYKTEVISSGSSLKLCKIAVGDADIYPRIAPTMEWDTAAAHAIVLEAGKNIYKYDDKIAPIEYMDAKCTTLEALTYNTPTLINKPFVAV